MTMEDGDKSGELEMVLYRVVRDGMVRIRGGIGYPT